MSSARLARQGTVAFRVGIGSCRVRPYPTAPHLYPRTGWFAAVPAGTQPGPGLSRNCGGIAVAATAADLLKGEPNEATDLSRFAHPYGLRRGHRQDHADAHGRARRF